jgi:LuxR family transcriptional regulator, quorum-sensing system regulator BjaR1
MDIDAAIGSIETSTTLEELKLAMQRIIEKIGFSSYNFIDAGRAYQDVPFFFGTTGRQWESEYTSNAFVHIDPYIAKARRSNLPFDWQSIPTQKPRRGPKPGVARLMEAAYSFGYREGLVVPYHFKDDIGRMHSTVCVFYWKEQLADYDAFLKLHRHKLHILVIYFMQRSMNLIARQSRGEATLFQARSSVNCQVPAAQLTDRERDVLSWAGRGKTISETADILKLSDLTVETHVKRALLKLGAQNKTHAVAKCINLGWIDL